MLRTFTRSLTQDLKVNKGKWADFSSRSESLKIKPPSPLVPPPPSPKVYHSPLLINETFQEAYNLLQEESAELYEKAQSEKDASIKDTLLAKAEEKNPEALYNMEFNSSSLDLSQPVYRKYAESKWKGYDLMVLMQRLEQFKVIPDTMPTLEPKVDVKVKFPHNTKADFSGWITPGTLLPALAVSRPPTVQIQHFDSSDVNEQRKYTILLVNPDEPDLDRNSFKTTLNFGLSNLNLTLKDNCLDAEKYLKEETAIFKAYQPVLPEMNAGTYQRACLWVFQQKNSQDINVDISSIDSSDFDIRKFAKTYELQAVGAHMWRQAYDRSVNDVRSQYGLPRGRVFHRVRKPHPLN